MPEPVRRLVELWRNAEVAIRPGVSPSAIQAFEKRYGVRLPNDLRDYFLTVDGMDAELDPGFNRFWPLEMVKPASEELADVNPDRWSYPNCYVIVDHLIWSFGWAIKLDGTADSGQVVQVTGGTTSKGIIASSFTAFLEMYLENQFSIL